MSDRPDALLLDPETVARIERENTTVGQYERLAGIGQSHEERLAFWLQFKHEDGQECIRPAMNECRRRIGFATAHGAQQQLSTDSHAIPAIEAAGARMNIEVDQNWRPTAANYFGCVKKDMLLQTARETVDLLPKNWIVLNWSFPR